MNVETFNAIQTVKYVLQSRGQTAVQMFEGSDVKFGEVDRIIAWANPSLSRTLSMMDPVQRRRWFTLSSPIQVKLRRRTTATWRHMALRWMTTCLTSRSLHIQEDACSPNDRPGSQKLEMFCSLLVEMA
ncbi:hypothetical protein MHYP_G00194270 [Metynnis hypsauchen]